MTTKFPAFCVAAIVLTTFRCYANLGDSPQTVAARLKGRLLEVKQGLDRHMVEATFDADGFWKFTFLDGQVCRETHVKRGDASQDSTIKQLFESPESAGHQWDHHLTTNGNERWRRDDGKIDIVYGAVEKSPIKHALSITAPGYEQHLEQIAANGSNIPGNAPTADEIKLQIESTLQSSASVSPSEQSAAYQFGYSTTRYGIPLAIVGLIIRAWTRRVARKTPRHVMGSRGQYYRRLLLKMSWRTGTIFLVSMFVVMLSQMPPSISPQEAGQAGGIALLLPLLVCPTVMLITSWTQANVKFATPPPIPVQAEAPRELAIPSSAQLSSRRANSTWWKRLFTVLEITVFLTSLLLVIALVATLPSYDSRWPLLILLIVPVVIVRSVRIAVIYIIEGCKPFAR